MRIYVTSVLVDDQAKAADFYTRILGFKVKNDVPLGEHRWLTVVSPENPVRMAVLDDTCGNLIQLIQMKRA